MRLNLTPADHARLAATDATDPEVIAECQRVQEQAALDWWRFELWGAAGSPV